MRGRKNVAELDRPYNQHSVVLRHLAAGCLREAGRREEGRGKEGEGRRDQEKRGEGGRGEEGAGKEGGRRREVGGMGKGERGLGGIRGEGGSRPTSYQVCDHLRNFPLNPRRVSATHPFFYCII